MAEETRKPLTPANKPFALSTGIVYRYDDKAQKVLASKAGIKLKTKPEPWMHVVLIEDSKGGKPVTHAVVFIWDTRKVLEEATGNDWARYLVSQDMFTRAKDNGAKLEGGKAGAKGFNVMKGYEKAQQTTIKNDKSAHGAMLRKDVAADKKADKARKPSPKSPKKQ